jgi:hypothetical protein
MALAAGNEEREHQVQSPHGTRKSHITLTKLENNLKSGGDYISPQETAPQGLVQPPQPIIKNLQQTPKA